MRARIATHKRHSQVISGPRNPYGAWWLTVGSSWSPVDVFFYPHSNYIPTIGNLQVDIYGLFIKVVLLCQAKDGFTFLLL